MKIEKILLIDPPFFRFMGERQSSTPLGLAYLAGVLLKYGYDVNIYNADFTHEEQVPECNKAFFDEVQTFDLYKKLVTDPGHPLYNEVISFIEKYKPHLIGMTVRTGKFFISKNIVRKIKKAFPDIPVVIGGNHVTANPDHSLARIDADYAIRGEGENSFLRLIRALSKNAHLLSDVGGLSYREGQTIRHAPHASLIQNLDEIPFPARDVIINNNFMTPEDFGNIFSTRGCPFGCTFCDSRTTWTRKVRCRSPKNVVDEIVETKEKYKTGFFSFSDDCFVTKKELTFALCEEMDRRGLSSLPKKEFRWWCEIHPNLISEQLVSRVKKSGCVAIAIGAESGSQRTLAQIKKVSSSDVIRRAAKIIKDHDIDLTTFFMIGFPWETQDDINATVELMRELAPDSGNLSILTPLPNTEIYSYCEERGLIDYDDDYLNFYHQRNSSFYNPNISQEQSREIIMEAFKEVDSVIEGNRKKKIERVLESKTFPAIRERYGLNLAFGERDGVDIAVRCNQKYAEATVLLEMLPTGLGSDKLNLREIERSITEDLLREMPQYSKIQFERQL